MKKKNRYNARQGGWNGRNLSGESRVSKYLHVLQRRFHGWLQVVVLFAPGSAWENKPVYNRRGSWKTKSKKTRNSIGQSRRPIANSSLPKAILTALCKDPRHDEQERALGSVTLPESKKSHKQILNLGQTALKSTKIKLYSLQIIWRGLFCCRVRVINEKLGLLKNHMRIKTFYEINFGHLIYSVSD